MSMPRFYHRDPCEHRIAAVLAEHYQHFGCRLPFRSLLFNFGQLGDVERGVAQSDERHRGCSTLSAGDAP
jgi:hypothetical protein